MQLIALFMERWPVRGIIWGVVTSSTTLLLLSGRVHDGPGQLLVTLELGTVRTEAGTAAVALPLITLALTAATVGL